MKRTVLAATSGMAADLGVMGHLFESHYDLEYWLYHPIPGGELPQFTPDVNCEHHQALM